MSRPGGPAHAFSPIAMVLRRARAVFAPRVTVSLRLRSDLMLTRLSYATFAGTWVSHATRLERWCERLVTRETRPDRVPAGAPGSSPPAVATPVDVVERLRDRVRPVPLVVAERRSLPPPARHDPAELRHAEARRADPMSWPPRLGAVAAPDVDALTERVVQSINRRLSAHAERLLRR